MASAFAWGGGAAFVASLAYFVYTYAVTLGRPGDTSGGDLVTSVVVNCLLFTVFATHHSLFARAAVKRWLTRFVPPALQVSFFVWVASLLLALACAAWRPVPGTLYRHTGLLAVLHLVPVGFGAALTALGARRLDPLDLAGIRQAARLAPPRRPADEELVTRFPYNFVRHPIYLGWALFVFGVADMTWNRLLMACLSTGYLVVAIPWEERLLTRTFGAAYERYRQRVRWRMIPLVY